MNDTDFKSLAKRSLSESTPKVDVADVVLRRIRCQPTRSLVDDPLPWFAAATVTSAAATLLFTYSTWTTVHDPLMALVEPFRVILP
ncbi:MAG: hypothetical protein FJ267_06070 [Planctomycetes bacterium]|nr:hypothetical protein [Planctomycetota bacterium]